MKYKAELGRASVAVLLAVALWLVVSAEETTAAWVPVHIELMLDPTVSVAEVPPDASAFIVGRRRDLFKLISSPPTIERAVTDDNRDSVRIELRTQDIDLPAGAEIVVRELRPRLVTVRLHRVRPASEVQDLLLKPRASDSTLPVQADSVLDSLARAKIIADSAAMSNVKRDTTLSRRPPN